jgi:hypothetical protein
LLAKRPVHPLNLQQLECAFVSKLTPTMIAFDQMTRSVTSGITTRSVGTIIFSERKICGSELAREEANLQRLECRLREQAHSHNDCV